MSPSDVRQVKEVLPRASTKAQTGLCLAAIMIDGAKVKDERFEMTSMSA